MTKKHLSAAAAAVALFLGTGVTNADTSGTSSAALAANIAHVCEITVDSLSDGESVQVNDVLYDLDPVTFTMSISCNDIEGATVSGGSTLKGLTLDDDQSIKIAYNVSVSGFANGPLAFLSTATGASLSEPGSETLASVAGVPLTVTLTSTGEYAEWAGSYDDSLVFSIAANL